MNVDEFMADLSETFCARCGVRVIDHPIGDADACVTLLRRDKTRLRRERDELRALLRECRAYIDARQPHPTSPVGQLLNRLDAALGGER